MSDELDFVCPDNELAAIKEVARQIKRLADAMEKSTAVSEKLLELHTPRKIQYSFTSNGVQVVRDGFKSIVAHTANDECDLIEFLMERNNGKMVALIVTYDELRRLKMNDRFVRLSIFNSTIVPPAGYDYHGTIGSVDIFSPLPADPPKPDSPSE